MTAALRAAAGDQEHMMRDPHIPQQHLAELAAAIQATTPLRATVIAADAARPAMLRVINPDAADLAEDITCRPDGSGLVFWWSWSERICSVADIDDTARTIARVLRGVDR